MTPDEFRQHGYQVIDWIADYMRDVERYPVLVASRSRRDPAAVAGGTTRAGRVVRSDAARREGRS